MTRQFGAALLATTLFFSLAGCEKGFKGQTYSKAPEVISDEFLVAGVSEAEVSELMSKNPQAKVRRLAHETYGFTGLTKRQILEESPKAIIEVNEFIPLQGRKGLDRKELLSKTFHNAFQEDASQEFSPDNCTENAILRVPRIIVTNSNNELSPTFNVGEDLKLLFKEPKTAGITAWFLSPPMGSKLSVQFEGKDDFKFAPDMPGSYGVALFFKRNGQCNVKVTQVVVSSNEAYSSELSESDTTELQKLSRIKFKQVTSTRAHMAQTFLTNHKSEIVVAVLDSGVNYNHPALKENIWVNKNEIPGDLIDNDNNGYVDDVVGYDFENNDGFPMDDIGHGSHVAGLVAGKFMGTGSAPNIKIMALKGGSEKGVDLGSMIQGIDYAIDNGAHIINMSFGSHQKRLLIKTSIARAAEKGVLVVTTSGNGDHRGIGLNNDLYPYYPASYEVSNILSVGAVKSDGSLTRYSNYGETSVDVATLGGHSDLFERSANLLNSAYLPNPSGILIQPMAGTSMAAPIVSGIAALLLAQDPSLTPEEVRELIMTTGKRSEDLQGVVLSGSVVDAEKALLSL